MGVGRGRKRLERKEDTEEGEQGRQAAKAMFRSSQEGEIPQCLNGQENHLKIAAFGGCMRIYILFEKTDLRQAERYGKAFSTREMK